MMQIPWLTLVTFLPAVFALLVAFVPKSNAKAIRTLAMAGTLATFAVSLVIYANFNSAYIPHGIYAQFQMVDRLNWITFGHTTIHYLMGLDGISLLMVLMTTIIFPFVVGVSFKEITERTREYYCWTLIMETAILGVFLSLNLVLYYLFWEAMLIPMYFLIGIWGGPRRIYATVKFFLYTMVGSMVMLVSIMALYFYSGQQTLDLPQLQQMISTGALAFKGGTEMLLFVGFFLAFGIKAPIWPFHTWVPDAYSQAPTGGTIILVALKMGLYGFLRFCLPLFPHAVKDAAPLIITLAVIGVIYAALVAAMQTDLKRLIAYSSISHIGVIMLAIFSLTSVGISGGVIQMVSHTITTGALFILLGALYARRRSYQIGDFGGLMKPMPAFTVIFLIATLSSVALPTTSGFTGELLMLMGSFQPHPWATGFATTAAIWSVVYMLWMFQRVMYGPITHDENNALPDWTGGEKWALVPLVLLIFFLGLYPKPVLDALNPSVNTTLAQAHPAAPLAFSLPNTAATAAAAPRTAER